MVSDFFYPNVGGVEGHIYAVSRELVRRGHRVIIITHAYDGANSRRIGVRHLSPKGLTVYHLPLVTLPSQSTLPNFFTSLPLLTHIFQRERIHIVHAHQALSSLGHEALFHARSLASLSGGPQIKTVFTDHSLFALGGDAAASLTGKLLRFVLSDVHRVVAVSYAGKENTALRAHLDPRRVTVIPNAVDSASFHPASDEDDKHGDRITIVILSRLTYRKGISLLLELIPIICRLHPDVDFIIGGEGPKRMELEHMRERYHVLFASGPHPRVRIIGEVRGNEAVRQHLTSGQIFLSPSLTEAFGTTLIEASSCGLLCVATSVGGVPETLPSPELLMLAEPSTSDLVLVLEQAIQRTRHQMVSESAEERTRRQWQQHDFVRRTYSWTRTAVQLEEQVYLPALEQRITDNTLQGRLQRYWDNNNSASGDGVAHSGVASFVFCIVVMTQFTLTYLMSRWCGWNEEEIEVCPSTTTKEVDADAPYEALQPMSS